MKRIIVGLLTTLLFLGCSSKESVETDIEPMLVVGKNMAAFTLNDQHEKPHSIAANTKTLIFAFSKDIGHTCNEFFATKSDSYLSDNNALFIADVSAAPSIIKSMFIMPGLKEFKHPVLIIDDESVSKAYKSGQDDEKIIIVFMKDKTITAIKPVSTNLELAASIEAK